jgi:hypothetical protein
MRVISTLIDIQTYQHEYVSHFYHLDMSPISINTNMYWISINLICCGYLFPRIYLSFLSTRIDISFLSTRICIGYLST